jgi:hypothetical protein
MPNTWISTEPDKYGNPDVFIRCQGCRGAIMFKAQEILDRKARSTNTSTPCKHCGWHPVYPPFPWILIGDLGKPPLADERIP